MSRAALGLRVMLLCLLCGVRSVSAEPGPPAPLLTREEQDWIAAHPVLRVAVFDSLVPFEYMSGAHLRGLSSKYLEMITQKTGLRFAYVASPDRRVRVKQLLDGEVDLISALRSTYFKHEDSGVLFTRAYHDSSSVVITRVGENVVVDLGQLAGKTVSVLRSEQYFSLLQKWAPGVTLISAHNPLEMLTAVKDGKADATISYEGLLVPYLHRQFQGVLQISGVIRTPQSGVSMAVRTDQAVLFSILQKSLASITVDESKAIYDRWFADMDLDIPSIQAITEHFVGELVLLLLVVVLLLALVYQSRQQRRRARRNEREKAMFLAVMSHEIRSPMNAVLAAVELLGHTPLDDQQRHFTDLANSGANSLLRLLDDVLDISKLEAGQLKLNLEPVDLLALVRGVVDLNRLRAAEKGLTLTVTGGEDFAPLLLDDTRLSQVLRNLLSNAIKFTEKGDVRVELQRLDGLAGSPRQLLIRVSDSGIGLSAAAQAALFRPYAQAEHSYKRTGGTGLGLVICRELVKLMQGKLTFSSTLAVGTTVEVLLPMNLAATLALSPRIGEQVPGAAPLADSGLRILVIEDTLANQEVLRAQIQGLGCEALLAADAAQGLALFTEQRFDLVLMDCDLPDRDGYSLACEFRDMELDRLRAYCPIIAISALTGNEHLERCFDAGMDGVLSKPIRLFKLQEVIELWCDVTLAQQAQPQTFQALQPSAAQEEVRRDLSNLLRATALRDHAAALHAAHRLHGAVLALQWHELAQPAHALEQLLREPVGWGDARLLQRLRELTERWSALGEIPA